MRGVDEGNERRTTYTEKEERERERDDDKANVPVSVHAAPGTQRLAPTQEACLYYS